jgi:hypothetical protein
MYLTLTKKVAGWIIFDFLPDQPSQIERASRKVARVLALRVLLVRDVQPAEGELVLVNAALPTTKNCSSPGVRELFDDFWV